MRNITTQRLSIYFFYNEQGFVGDYVLYYLDEMRKFSKELCVVVNEPLSTEGRTKLTNHCDTLIVRENIGYDSAAYKCAIKHYGYEFIKEQFDQVILSNFTCYGPIYPLDEMFEKMDKDSCDMWGMNKHPAQNAYLIPGIEDSKVIEHIQSFFHVFKSSIINDFSFEEYWETLKVPYTYQQAILFHEIRCSNFFEKKGFKTNTYINFDKYKEYILNHTIYLARRMVEEDRLPILKRKVFFIDNMQLMYNSWGHDARDLLNYIDQRTTYNIDLIWQDLIKTQKMSVLRNQLHLNYYLPTNHLITSKASKSKIALIIFVFFEDEYNYVLKYANNMPSNTDIYIISAYDSLLKLYESKSSLMKTKYNFFFRLMEQNRGRDVSAYLVAASDVYSKYDYLCCIHDKKTKQLNDSFASDEFKYYCFENCLSSPEFVANIITTFDENKKLGMLVPPTLNFGYFFLVLSHELGSTQNITNIKKLFKEFKITVPFDDHPVAPFGTMFWVRGKAFKTILSKKWKYEDFPQEPNANDGTILHAIERFYPISVQESGYFVGFVATSFFSSVYADCNSFYVMKYNERLSNTYPGHAMLHDLLEAIGTK